MDATVEAIDTEILNPLLEKAAPEKIVSWANAEFGSNLIMSSSFGAESAVLLHMATRILLQIKVVFIDTGYLFAETFSFMEDLRRRFDLNVWTYRPRNDPFAYLKKANELDPARRNDINACCAANKNEPFERALHELQPAAWLRGIRRSQAASRSDAQIVEWSKRYDCYAVSPLLNWTTREVDAYMTEHDLPYHPLREAGYL